MKTIAIVLMLAMGAMAADLSGLWIGSFKVVGGDRKEPQQFILKQRGKKLTGSGGPDAVEQYPIENGKVDGELVSFELSSGNWKFKYELKRVGRELNGDLQLQSANDARSAKVTLKKVD